MSYAVFTDWRSSCEQHHDFKNKNNIETDAELRRFLQKEAPDVVIPYDFEKNGIIQNSEMFNKNKE